MNDFDKFRFVIEYIKEHSNVKLRDNYLFIENEDDFESVVIAFDCPFTANLFKEVFKLEIQKI